MTLRNLTRAALSAVLFSFAAVASTPASASGKSCTPADATCCCKCDTAAACTSCCCSSK